MVFTRPSRSLIMPNRIPPVAQPTIRMNVASAPFDFTTASATPLPSNSRIAGSRARNENSLSHAIKQPAAGRDDQHQPMIARYAVQEFRLRWIDWSFSRLHRRRLR